MCGGGEIGDLVRHFIQNCLFQDSGIRTFKGEIAGKHLVGHHCEGVLVGRGALFFAAPLFRRHVRTGAGCAVIRHTDPGHGCVDLGGKTEVQHLHIAHTVDHDVSRLDVPVDDLLGMSVVQCVRHLPDDRQNVVQRQGVILSFSLDPTTQVFPLAALHDEVIVPVFGVALQIVAGGNMGVKKSMDQLEVVLDVIHLKGIVGKFRRQGFEGDFDARGLVETLVNHAHSALSQLGKDLVAPHDQVAGFKTPIRLPVMMPGHGLIHIRHIHRRALGRDGLIQIFCHGILSVVLISPGR